MKLHSYYRIKPFIPRNVQIGLRRFRAQIIKRTNNNSWPIDEKSGVPPQNWPGWPEGKKFAFILTHDVESQVGMNKCLALMEVDRQYGFRSSFNFVPHDYMVPSELRNRIRGEGFEIGVHGLKHDGNMFKSRKKFESQSQLINGILKSWDAVGFRAPSMYHNLDWTLDLEIEYDSSTFDTDPFEPQKDGVGTIFPFLVKGDNARKGYIELPYTLPQDFTLFIILKNESIETWKTKLDWIASHGGMALLNSHPDYINFNGNEHSIEEYPLSYYEEFLSYVKNNYEGQFWQPLPREAARYCRYIFGRE